MDDTTRAQVRAKESKITTNLDRRLTLWVKFASPDATDADIFTVPITPITEVSVVREAVRAKASAMLLHDDDLDGTIRLVYEGRVLEDGTTMSDYPLEKARARYPAPYAGTIIISPLRDD